MPDKTAQQRFDEQYISAAEICRTYDIDRVRLHQGRRRGLLPNAIEIRNGGGFLWEREPIEPYLKEFIEGVYRRRGVRT